MNEDFQLCMLQIIKGLHQRYLNSLKRYDGGTEEDKSFQAGLRCAYFLALNEIIATIDKNGYGEDLYNILKQFDKDFIAKLNV